MLDIIKLEKQRNINYTYKRTINELLAKGYLRANFLGVWPWGLLMFSGRGLFYGTNSSYMNNVLKNRDISEKNRKILSSCYGGLMEGLLTSPFALMRTRVVEMKTSKNINF